MKLKTTLIALAGISMLIPSCESVGSFSGKKDTLNNSALYDPTEVTLIPGKTYEFKEGTLQGRGQKFHSDFSFRQMLIEQ
jgi:hypothetical protein